MNSQSMPLPVYISQPNFKMNRSTAQKTLVPWCIYSLLYPHEHEKEKRFASACIFYDIFLCPAYIVYNDD